MIKIITDSSASLKKQTAEELGITVLPLNLIIEGQSYLDGIEITNEEFYERLDNVTELPKTSQILPEYFEREFNAVKESGDEAIVILISSELSGTYATACSVKETVGYDKVYVFDSLNALQGEQLLIFAACDMAKKGMSGEEIISELEKLRPRVRFISMVDTLKFLQMGGRLSSAKAFVGELLKVKPILIMENGKLVSAAKEIGVRRAMRKMKSLMDEDEPDPDYPVLYSYSKSPENLYQYLREVGVDENEVADKIGEISPVAGTHTGPNALAVMYVAKN